MILVDGDYLFAYCFMATSIPISTLSILFTDQSSGVVEYTACITAVG